MSKPSALIVGAANLDRHASLLVPHVPGTSNRAMINEMPGGAALNVASRFAACGGEATLITALGSDAADLMIRETLQDRGVNLHAAPAESTGTYTSLLEPDGELLTAISDMTAAESFDPVLPDRPFDWTVIDANLSPEAIEAVANHASENLVLLTVSIAKALRLRPVLSKASLVFGTIAELAAMSSDAPEPFQWFREQTDATLVASDGIRPLWLLQGDSVRPFPVVASTNVRDVVGAGDTLIGTILYALATGRPMDEALALGMDAAGRVVEISGPHLAEI